MLAALIAGQRDPQILAQYGPWTGCARKFSRLEEAFAGRFTRPPSPFLLSKMLARVDRRVDTDLADLDARIEADTRPFRSCGGTAG